MIQSVDKHYLIIIKYVPIKGSSFIPLPPELSHHMKGLINIKNKDNDCFRLCHIGQLNPMKRNPDRITKADKAYVNQLNCDGIGFPVTVNQYNKIEKQNSINVNVFGYEKTQKYPICISKEQYNKTLNLLLITFTSESEENNTLRPHQGL